MPLSYRVFIVYALFVLGCGYFVTYSLLNEIKPGVRQSTEETLVDTANLLAELLVEPLERNQLHEPIWKNWLARYGKRPINADIWGMKKTTANHRIYVTDLFGIVLLDSKGIAVGEDYSQWRDVYLTLRGHYGARSTKSDPSDEKSTVMHVAAPIKSDDKIIGVVTVTKPNRSLQPYIARAQWRLGITAFLFVISALIIGAGLAWWFGRNIQRLTRYAREARIGDRQKLNIDTFPRGELRQLAAALEGMRRELDGKNYIERYIQTLTHELKSPIAGIRAASEVLLNPLPAEQRENFSNNIERDCKRLQNLIDRVLSLAKVEQQSELEHVEVIDLQKTLKELIEAINERASRKSVRLSNNVRKNTFIEGDPFLLKQAINNLLENALDFCHKSSAIQISFSEQPSTISIANEGSKIPDYALPRITERFYSLPRPSHGNKSTGLGLNFVAEVIALHKGEFTIENTESGVMASMQLGAATQDSA